MEKKFADHLASLREHLLTPEHIVREVVFILLGVAIGFFADWTVSALILAVAFSTLVISLAFYRLSETTQRIGSSVVGELKRELDDHLSTVHATVRFVEENTTEPEDDEPAYSAARRAVDLARKEILVVSDYSPPKGTGPELGEQPVRNEYLDHTLEVIRAQASRRSADAGPSGRFRYVRLIQRPEALYRHLEHRSNGRITLHRNYMNGDEEVYDHVDRLFTMIKDEPDIARYLDHSIRLAPFLPNCPSMLVVDKSVIQFTIPSRSTNQMQNEFGEQKLHGVLIMEDRKNGREIAPPFSRLVEHLLRHSLPVVDVTDENDPTVDADSGMPLAGRI